MEQLTPGAVHELVDGPDGAALGALLQVLAIKRVQQTKQTDEPQQERFRLAMSDGTNYAGVLLAITLNSLVLERQLTIHSIVRLTNYTCNVVQEKRIVIMTQLEVVSHVPNKIGTPVAYERAFSGQSAQQSSAYGQARPQPINQMGQRVTGNQMGPRQGGIGTGYGQAVVGGGDMRYGQGDGARVPQMSHGANFPSGGNIGRAAAAPGGGYQGQAGTGGMGAMGQQAESFGNGQAAHKGRTVTKVARLNPYQNRWLLQVRVVNKTPIKHWANQKGEGQLISMELLDDSGEIRATGFHELADRIDKTVEVGKVYYISGGQIKNANRQFSNVNNPYELTLDKDALIELCVEGSQEIPRLTYKFVPIGQLEQYTKDSFVDVVAIVKAAQPITVITTRSTGKQVAKRDLTLVDDSQAEVSFTLWGANAENYNEQGFPVVAVKGARVGDYRGLTLSAVMSSVIQFNPDLREAHQLRGWFDSVGSTAETVSLSNVSGGSGGHWTDERLTIDQAKNRVVHMADQSVYFITSGFITLVKKDPAYYKACPTEECNKKLIETSTGWMCEKCGVERDTFKIRLMLSMSIADPVGQAWVTAFHEQAEQILGINGQELYELHETNEEAYNMRFESIAFTQGIFRLRVKMETFQDEQRPRFNLQGYKAQDFTSDSSYYLADIARLQAF